MESFRRGSLVFDVRDRGPADAGDVVVLLHGFPATAASWDGVVPALTDAGFRTLAPNQRGYSPSARPSGRRAYRMEELVGDVLALADAAGVDRFHVVGHDMGANVAWNVAATHPDRVATLAAVSVPHPRAFAEAMTRGLQGLRSWYMGAFQLPGLPERALLAQDGRVLRQLLARSGLPEEATAKYVEHMRQPGAMTGAINWYRGLSARGSFGMGAVATPTLLVWSTGDRFVSRAAVDGCERHVAGPYRLEVLEGVTHWIPEEAPDRLARVLLEHLQAHVPG